MTYGPPTLTEARAASEQAERAKQTAATLFLIDSAHATETLVEDILTLIAGHNPEAVENLRDHAAAMSQRISDGRAGADDMPLGGFYERRLSITRAALEKVGRPYIGGDVVSLDDARQAQAGASKAPTPHDRART